MKILKLIKNKYFLTTIGIVVWLLFFDKNDERVLAAFFTKMYDEDKKLNQKRKSLFDNLFKKYGKQEVIMTH